MVEQNCDHIRGDNRVGVVMEDTFDLVSSLVDNYLLRHGADIRKHLGLDENQGEYYSTYGKSFRGRIMEELRSQFKYDIQQFVSDILGGFGRHSIASILHQISVVPNPVLGNIFRLEDSSYSNLILRAIGYSEEIKLTYPIDITYSNDGRVTLTDAKDLTYMLYSQRAQWVEEEITNYLATILTGSIPTYSVERTKHDYEDYTITYSYVAPLNLRDMNTSEPGIIKLWNHKVNVNYGNPIVYIDDATMSTLKPTGKLQSESCEYGNAVILQDLISSIESTTDGVPGKITYSSLCKANLLPKFKLHFHPADRRVGYRHSIRSEGKIENLSWKTSEDILRIVYDSIP